MAELIPRTEAVPLQPGDRFDLQNPNMTPDMRPYESVEAERQARDVAYEIAESSLSSDRLEKPPVDYMAEFDRDPRRAIAEVTRILAKVRREEVELAA